VCQSRLLVGIHPAHRLVIVGMRPQADLDPALVQMNRILDWLRLQHTILNPVLGAIQLRSLLGDPDTVIKIRKIRGRCLTGLDGSPQKG
jgi:hypothetical protein